MYDCLKTPIISTVKNLAKLSLKEKFGFSVYVSSSRYGSLTTLKNSENVKEKIKGIMEDKTSCTHTKPSEEMDLPNYSKYSIEKLLRSKTIGKPKTLDKA